MASAGRTPPTGMPLREPGGAAGDANGGDLPGGSGLPLDQLARRPSPGPAELGPALIQVAAAAVVSTTSLGILTMAAKQGELQLLKSSRVYPLRKREENPFGNMVTLGRAMNNDLVVPHRAVSKFHAYFRPTGAQWSVYDAGSLNGTQVAGRRLPTERAQPLQPGVELVLGEAVRLLYLDGAALEELLATCRG